MKLCIRATAYRMSFAIRDYTVLPSTQHKWTHPALTSTRQAGSQLTHLHHRDGRLKWPRWLVTYWDTQTATDPSTKPAVHGQELNSESADHKSEVLTTTKPGGWINVLLQSTYVTVSNTINK